MLLTWLVRKGRRIITTDTPRSPLRARWRGGGREKLVETVTISYVPINTGNKKIKYARQKHNFLQLRIMTAYRFVYNCDHCSEFGMPLNCRAHVGMWQVTIVVICRTITHASHMANRAEVIFHCVRVISVKCIIILLNTVHVKRIPLRYS